MIMKREYKLKPYCRKNIDSKYFILPKKRIGTGMDVMEVNETGNDILSLLEQCTTIGDIIEQMSILYGISENNYAELEKDIWNFLEALESFEIIELSYHRHNSVQLKRVADGSIRVAQMQELYAEKLLPYKFFIEMTYNCNLRCRHCYKTSDVNNARINPQYLRKERAFELLDEIEEIGALEVYFTGGEMFTNPDAYEIIEYACKKNFLTIILTNGTLIMSDKCISRIKHLPIFDIRVSIYGNQEAHDDFTRVPGSFQKSISTLRKVNDTMGIGTAVFVVTNYNFSSRTRLINVLNQYDINFSLSTHLTPTSDGELFPLRFRITMDQFKQLYREFNIPIQGTSCSAGMSRFRISPTGDVNPCELMRDITFGNINEQSLKEIMNSKARSSFITKFHERVSKMPCNHCVNQDSCTFCPASFYLETNDLLIPSAYECKLSQIKHSIRNTER